MLRKSLVLLLFFTLHTVYVVCAQAFRPDFNEAREHLVQALDAWDQPTNQRWDTTWVNLSDDASAPLCGRSKWFIQLRVVTHDTLYRVLLLEDDNGGFVWDAAEQPVLQMRFINPCRFMFHDKTGEFLGLAPGGCRNTQRTFKPCRKVNE